MPSPDPTPHPQAAMAPIRFDLITLFPEFFETFRAHGVCGRAIGRGLAALHCWNPRRHTQDVHQTVDDRPYGGGPGMVMMAGPLAATVREVQADCAREGRPTGPVVLMSPAGQTLTQAWVEAHARPGPAQSELRQITLVCGRYEGIDQRFIDQFVTEEISIGDVVLSGGEVPALAVLDAIVRRLPGALGDEQSALCDSFQNGLLDHPHYTRPEVFEGRPVPEVLLSGHHGKIADWREEASRSLTERRRPDLLKNPK